MESITFASGRRSVGESLAPGLWATFPPLEAQSLRWLLNGATSVGTPSTNSQPSQGSIGSTSSPTPSKCRKRRSHEAEDEVRASEDGMTPSQKQDLSSGATAASLQAKRFERRGARSLMFADRCMLQAWKNGLPRWANETALLLSLGRSLGLTPAARITALNNLLTYLRAFPTECRGPRSRAVLVSTAVYIAWKFYHRETKATDVLADSSLSGLRSGIRISVEEVHDMEVRMLSVLHCHIRTPKWWDLCLLLASGSDYGLAEDIHNTANHHHHHEWTGHSQNSRLPLFGPLPTTSNYLPPHHQSSAVMEGQAQGKPYGKPFLKPTRHPTAAAIVPHQIPLDRQPQFSNNPNRNHPKPANCPKDKEELMMSIFEWLVLDYIHHCHVRIHLKSLQSTTSPHPPTFGESNNPRGGPPPAGRQAAESLSPFHLNHLHGGVGPQGSGVTAPNHPSSDSTQDISLSFMFKDPVLLAHAIPILAGLLSVDDVPRISTMKDTQTLSIWIGVLHEALQRAFEG